MGVQHHFGAGTLIGTNLTANSTPRKFGTLQEVSIELGFDVKRLMGQYKFPVDIGQAGGKVTGKAKFARINGGALNDLFFNSATGVTTGMTLTQDAESQTVPATPFQITITPPSSGTFLRDLGVFNATTGSVMGRVASSPAAGEYSVNESTGVYTFNTADEGLAVYISYDYTISTGHEFILDNQLSGNAQPFAISLFNSRNARGLHVRLNSCLGSKISAPFTNEDFMKSDFEFEAFADVGNVIGKIGFTEA